MVWELGVSKNDPFGDYDLEDDGEGVSAKKKSSAKKRSRDKHKRDSTISRPKQSEASDQSARPRAANFPVLAFKFEESLRGTKKCSQCYHYIQNAGLASEQIYEIKEPEFFDLVQKLNDFEESVGVHEVREVIENAKQLESKFSQMPRMRPYCGVDFKMRDYYIPEVKNFDGHCADFLPGQRPTASCHCCKHHRETTKSKPYPSDFNSDIPSTFFDPDLPDGGLGSYERIRKIESSQYEQAQREYYYELELDVSDAILRDESLTHMTIDECYADFRACATVNRGGGCPRYENKEHANDPDPAKMLREFYDREYHNTEDPPAKPSAADPPCLSCRHAKAPAKIDPFDTTVVNRLSLLDLIKEFEREQQQLIREEAQYLQGAGNYLGRGNPPVDTLWCAAYSSWHGEQVVEYAYCYRALQQGTSMQSCDQYAPKTKDT